MSKSVTAEPAPQPIRTKGAAGIQPVVSTPRTAALTGVGAGAEQKPGKVARQNGHTNGKHAPAVGGGGKDTAVKTFVLDTNILLHNPDALFVFKEHDVVIPFTVIEELDKMKRKDDDLGRNARGCIRNLDRLRAIGKLSEPINWGDLPAPARGAFSTGPGGKTGTVKIDVTEYPRPQGIDADAPDNRIIAVAYHLHSQGVPVVFVTKDLAARIKSDALGIKTEDFANQRVDADRLYTGFLNAAVETGVIDELYRDRLLSLERLAQPLREQMAVDAGATDAAGIEQFAAEIGRASCRERV